MCVAAVIHKPVSLKYLNLMQKENPDGAGVAWVEPGATDISFRRGLTADEIFDMQRRVLKTPYMLHFRWATQGASVPEMTHPFPLGPRALMGELSGTAPTVLIHNGTWHRGGQVAALRKSMVAQLMPEGVIEAASDTAIAAFLLPEMPRLIDDIHWATCLGWADAGKLALSFTGDWDTHEGNQYSNMYWLAERKYRAWSYTDYVPKFKTYPASVGVPDNFDDWTDYLRARYGDEVADEVTKWADGKQDAVDLQKLTDAEDSRAEQEEWSAFWARQESDIDVTQLNDAEDSDLISEDPEVVNRMLAREMIG